MWHLIIFFVAAAGSGAGGAIETVDFSTEAACVVALEKVKQVKPSRWSHVDAVCVRE